ncbi:hypothetical protein ACFW3N_37800 [Streptomyces sp. NPDC058834]|uniref:hypothetical protein n=1 Tax=Streptomyces sp. NPDC058834 TaxID=3346647 RepID=UPI003685CDAB
MSAPFGDLVPTEDHGPLLPASAGIGVTSMPAMLSHLAASGATRPVTVVHADRDPASHAHRREQLDLIRELPDARLHLWYEEPGDQAPEASAGHADIAGLALPAGLTVRLCGPLPFMRAVRGGLLRRGVPAAASHWESRTGVRPLR